MSCFLNWIPFLPVVNRRNLLLLIRSFELEIRVVLFLSIICYIFVFASIRDEVHLPTSAFNEIWNSWFKFYSFGTTSTSKMLVLFLNFLWNNSCIDPSAESTCELPCKVWNFEFRTAELAVDYSESVFRILTRLVILESFFDQLFVFIW